MADVRPLADLLLYMGREQFMPRVSDGAIMESVSSAGAWSQSYSWPLLFEGEGYRLNYTATIRPRQADPGRLVIVTASLRDEAITTLGELAGNVGGEPWEFNLISGDMVNVTGVKNGGERNEPVLFQYQGQTYDVRFRLLITRC